MPTPLVTREVTIQLAATISGDADLSVQLEQLLPPQAVLSIARMARQYVLGALYSRTEYQFDIASEAEVVP